MPLFVRVLREHTKTCSWKASLFPFLTRSPALPCYGWGLYCRQQRVCLVSCSITVLANLLCLAYFLAAKRSVRGFYYWWWCFGGLFRARAGVLPPSCPAACRPATAPQHFSEVYCIALRGAQGGEGCTTRPRPRCLCGAAPWPLAAAFSGLKGPVQGQPRAGRAEEPRRPPAPSAAAHWRRRAGAGPGPGRSAGRAAAGRGERRRARAVPCPPAPRRSPAPLCSAAPRSSRRTMVGDHCSLPGERPVLAQSPKPGLSCKMVLQAVGKVLR